MKKHLILIAAAVLATGCATKHYGRQGDITAFERDTMTCREIDLESAKVRGFLARVNAEHEKIDERSVLAFLGDFGLGNSLEWIAAKESAERRLASLHLMSAAKRCDAQG